MITDPIFYRLFETSPETFFLVLGMSTELARDMAARYQYEALEFKETAHRVDGLFRPKEPGLPLYLLEVQFYRKPSVFADLLVKAFSYLKQHDPGQEFVGVVLFGTRALEPKELKPYQALLNTGVVQCFYLDELRDVPEGPLGLSILSLIGQAESQAPATARELVARARNEIGDESLRSDLVELIETIIIYKLGRLSREEIQAMLQVHDIRETKVYQEAVKEGIEQERQRTIQEKLGYIATLRAMSMSAEAIAKMLGLDIEVVLKQMARE